MEHKRIKVIPKNPNPLFKKWLREWIEDAEKKKRRISKTYERALNSLNKYPLTLFSGHDCAILESFGPKICQMLDEKLEHHLSTRLDLFQQKCYKDKVSEVQRRESTRVSELVQNVEAACLADNTFGAATLDDIQEDVEMPEIPFQIDLSLKDDEFEVSTPPGDVEIPEELLSSSAESEDSFEKLLRKYDPEKATQKKFTKKISKGSGNAIKRQKIATTSIAIDLSMLPENSPIVPESYSPLSSVIKSGTRLKKFRTFDSGKSGRLAGPSYASSPISRFLDVEMTNQSPIPSSNFCNDSLDQLVAKYDFASPIPVVVKPSAPTAKLIKKPSLSKLRTINQVLKTAPSAIHEEAEDEMKYYSIDELNTQDFNVVLLVDIAETSG